MTKAEFPGDVIARIVSSFASRSDVGADDIIDLVVKLKKELGIQGEASTSAPQQNFDVAEDAGSHEPAMPIEQAVTQNTVYCLCCGKGFKMLKRHLGSEHGLTEPEYRRRYSLPDDMPLVAPSYSEQKASYAKKVKFGKYRRQGERTDAKQGENIS